VVPSMPPITRPLNSMADTRGAEYLCNGGFDDGPRWGLCASERHPTLHMKNLWRQTLFVRDVVGEAAHAGLPLAGPRGAWRLPGCPHGACLSQADPTLAAKPASAGPVW
jgi:hypothetical protein